MKDEKLQCVEMSMSKQIIIVVVFCALLFPVAGALGQVVKIDKNLVEVTVTGASTSKEEALHDAMRKAVERGAGTFIYSQSKTRDFVLVKDTILARSAGFIQSHKVLTSKQQEDGTWEVKIKAIVSVKGIVDTWGAVTTLLKQMGRPKIMVFIQEKIGNQVVPNSTVQTRIEHELLKSGFLLVNREQLKEIDKKDLAAAIAENNPAKVQAIAKRFGAQLFISGTAQATAGRVMNVSGIRLYAYQAEANIKCYRSDTAQMLSSIPGRSTRGVDRVWRSAANKALDAQARLIAPKVRNDILRFWQDVMEGRGEVQLHVEGISFKQYVALKKSLKKIKHIKAVNAKYHNKIAECSLESDIPAEALAEKIVEQIETLEITDVSQNVIKAKFKEE